MIKASPWGTELEIDHVSSCQERLKAGVSRIDYLVAYRYGLKQRVRLDGIDKDQVMTAIDQLIGMGGG